VFISFPSVKPPPKTPRVDDEHAAGARIAESKLPKSVEFPVVAIVMLVGVETQLED